MNKFILMIGLPASGKSTIAKEISQKENAIIHSSDSLREELFKDVNECGRNNELFQELHRRIKVDLQNNKNVILDATNVSWKKRKAFLDQLSNANKINCEKICYLVATPYEKCLQQNKLRDRKVPEHVIERMYKSFYIPQFYEGWDEININYNTEGYKFDTHELFNGENGLNKINQETPYHTLTIGEHCLKCATIYEELVDDCESLIYEFELSMASLYHDIGKRFVKEYNAEKGHYTYYQHHLVSAYDSLFYLMDIEPNSLLKIVNYIQWHMQPFFIKDSDKAKNKFIDLIGKETYDKLMILHKADKIAK